MKKHRRRDPFKTFLSLLFIFCALALFQTIFQKSDSQSLQEKVTNRESEKYRTAIFQELEKYHLENYTSVLLALMEQESHGQGGDPMQASESAGLSRNSIKDPQKSIETGVKQFQRVLTYGEKKQVDFAAIIQAYNMGPGYIDYVADRGGKHSEALAKQFSLLRVKENPSLYTCGGNRKNFRYPYCYGDFTYSTKVLKTLSLFTDATPVTSANKNPADTSN